MPGISVLIPLYNVEDTVELALRSILNSYEKDLEVIAVDDGSDDGTLDKLEMLAKRDHRIKVYSRQHEGIISSLNFAIKHINSPIFARMDGDDFSLPWRLTLQKQFLKKNKKDLIGGNMYMYGRSERTPYYYTNYPLSEKDILMNSLFDSSISHPCFFGRTSIFEIAEYLDEEDGAEDYGLIFRWIKGGVRVENMSRVLIGYRIIGERQTIRNKDSMERMREIVASKFNNLYDKPFIPGKIHEFLNNRRDVNENNEILLLEELKDCFPKMKSDGVLDIDIFQKNATSHFAWMIARGLRKSFIYENMPELSRLLGYRNMIKLRMKTMIDSLK